MSNHDPMNGMPAPAPQGKRSQRNRAYIMTAIAAAALTGAFASSSVGQQFGRLMAASPSGMEVAAFEGGFGGDFARGNWQSGLLNGAIEAIVEARADRVVRHLSIEIDATAEQQDKLRTIVRDTVKDLLPT